MQGSRFVAGLVALVAWGCGGEPDPAPAPGGGTGGSGEQQPEDHEFEPPECDDPQALCLPEPKQGFQIRSQGAVIDPGQDVEYCEVVTIPGGPDDVHYVNAFESQMTLGSHHLIVAAVEPDTETEANAIEGERVECSGPDAFGGELVPVTGAQQPYHFETFPEGVGRLYRGGQKAVFDYHYFNTTGETIQAQAAVNFHTVDAAAVKKIAQSFGFYNLGISIPPGASAGFDSQCTFSQDVMVHKLTRHTHRWGTDFSAWYLGGEHDGEIIFTSPDYETVDYPFEEPVLLRAGEGFGFRCEFMNTESYTLTFGLKATDEMCILFGSWFVVNEGDPTPDQSCLTF
jgi:hypothetical protein